VTVDPSADIGAVVLDVEGTTTPVAFVYEVLFPFARVHVDEFLQRNSDSADCRRVISLLTDERAAETGVTEKADIAAYVHWLMDHDRKSPGLKMLQGLIWEGGYRSGELKGEVFADVPPALKRWRARGRKTYIYSSGSVLAQQLLFSTTPAGDLTTLLSGYFDTAVGPKTSPESYRYIIARIGSAPSQALFVSDIPAELDAARDAGLRTTLCVRAAQSGPTASGHPVIHTFDDLRD
jgi:enolase-phosphatase E1